MRDEDHDSASIVLSEDNLATVSRDVVIQSLRRRLWLALQREDGDAALRIYKATRADWEKSTLLDLKSLVTTQREEKQHHQQRGVKNAFQNNSKTRRSSSSHNNSLRRSAASETVKTKSKQRTTADRTTSQPRSVGLLQQFMNPSDCFVMDDYKNPLNEPYNVNGENNQNTTPPNMMRRRRSSKLFPRQAIGFGWSSGRQHRRRQKRQQEEQEQDEENPPSILHDPSLDKRMTTPLHEAARLGHGELVRFMLKHPMVDPNARNGAGRTVLHMVAGGLTKKEATRIVGASQTDEKEATLGIRAPVPIVISHPEDTQQRQENQAKKAARAVGRLFRESLMHSKRQTGSCDQNSSGNAIVRPRKLLRISDQRWNQLVMDRTDAALAILSWTHPDDDSDRAGEGLSTNSVDMVGRTALHYAAELGRSEICMAVMSSFGAMLTIVDDAARTPCELAGERKHEELAAQLEARALLYVDPYGMDDELLVSVMTKDREEPIVPPFSWFETWTVEQVQEERKNRITQTLERMEKVIQTLKDETKASEVTFEGEVYSTKRVESDSTSGSSSDEDTATDNAENDEGSSKDEANAGDSPGKTSASQEEQVRKGDVRAFERMHKSHVGLYLTFHKWNVKKAVQAFLNDPFEAFREAAVPIPMLGSEEKNSASKEEESERVCLICFEEFDSESTNWRKLISCQHSFCTDCLGQYISDCSASKSSGLAVVCPHHECAAPMSPLEISQLSPTSDVYQTLLDAANEQFVVSARDFRFCPHPGCNGIVKLSIPPYVNKSWHDSGLLELVGAVCTATQHSDDDKDWPITYEGVHDRNYHDSKSPVSPRKAHRFCFVCGEVGIHWPVDCRRLEEWKDSVQEQVKEVQESEDNKDGDDNYNDISQKLWLKTNTQPCPKCKAPIQKNEGCNHMTCSNPHCKYEFCWICRNDWKLHNSHTGGFFRCNRWVDQKEHNYYDKPPQDDEVAAAREDITDPSSMAVTYGTAMHEARVAARRSRELARFLHHYQRWNAHAESAALEQKMSETVCSRLAPVVIAAVEYVGRPDFNFNGKGLSFVHAAFTELLECRSMLQHSYAFAYFHYMSTSFKRYKLMKRRLNEKLAFEHLQSELEIMVEQMSDVVARSHLRATQSQIVYLTATAADKRKEFSNLMIGIHTEEQKEKAKEEAAANGSGTPDKAAKRRQRKTLPFRIDHISGFANERSATRDDSTAPNQRTTAPDPPTNDDVYLPTNDDEDNEGIAAMEAVLQLSLEEFMSSNGQGGVYDMDDFDDEGLTGDWPCPVCTYMNAGGRNCAMCGTRRQ